MMSHMVAARLPCACTSSPSTFHVSFSLFFPHDQDGIELVCDTDKHGLLLHPRV